VSAVDHAIFVAHLAEALKAEQMKKIDTVESLTKRKEVLIEYLRTAIDEADWHACQDSASDIREIEAKLEILRQLDAR
jgi:hypothetical protein